MVDIVVRGAAAEDAADRPVISVDLGVDTGPVHSGATGLLYGLGDAGVPTRALIEGMRPRTVAQKAPAGLQHPTGDAVTTADGFFAAGGAEVLVYMQDVYAEWPYEQRGIEDYLAKARIMLQQVAERADRDRFAWVPFNEPDWIWYGDWAADRDRFLADWTALVHQIRMILPAARIVGPNEMRFNPDRLRDFLAWAAQRQLLPDVMAWHELRPESLTDYPRHHAAYRQLERELGIAALPINIDEYGNRRDFSVPARLVQWISMFEETKVDADLAYWTYAGNLDDHAVRGTEANGGWWLLRWYADLTGRTVAVRRDAGLSRAIATLDRDRREATVLVGGAGAAVGLIVTGLDREVFGDQVDVTRTAVSWTGYEGAALEPEPAARERHPVDTLRLVVPGGDPLAAHRFVLTPAEVDPDPRRARPATTYEAEDADITAGVVRRHDDDPQKYTASGGRDVAGLNQPDSAVAFTVTVPGDGTWRVGVFYATEHQAARQALWVDGRFEGEVRYPATLRDTYRGRLDLELDLTAGEHELSFRTAGPNGVLAGAEVALDRIDLSPLPVGGSVHPARGARLHGAARIVAGSQAAPAVVALGEGGSAQFFVATSHSGYHDVTIDARSRDARAGLRINGRAVPWPMHGSRTRRIHLGRGVTTLGVVAESGSLDLVAVRVDAARHTETDFPWLPAAALDLSRGAHLRTSTDGGEPYLDGLAHGALALPAGAPGGDLDLVLRYGSAATDGDHDYNTDVVSTSLHVGVDDAPPVVVRFGPTHAWDSFAEVVVPLQAPAGARVTLAGTAPAPTIAAVRLVPLLHPDQAR